ncbi:39S ribosomal protein L16, mitochondrial [Ixodes scapularis]
MAASLALRVALSPKKPLSGACRCRQWPLLLQACGLKLWKAPPDYGDVEFPEERRLRILEKTPQYPPGVSSPKMVKDLATIRGPELVHNKLLYNQYGIITSTDSLRLPSRSPSSGAVPVTPLSNRKVDAASSASTSGQGLTPPAPPGPLAPEGRGLPPRSSAPQRKPGGTCESRCLESGVSTDPEPCGFARPRMAVRGFPVSGEKGILVVEPSPG